MVREKWFRKGEREREEITGIDYPIPIGKSYHFILKILGLKILKLAKT